MKCEHDPIVQLDDLIRCRKCGELLPEMEEEIATVSSRKRANNVLQEIAVAGGYRASGMQDGFVVYRKMQNENEEEVTAQKNKGFGYKVVKRTRRLLGSDKTENN